MGRIRTILSFALLSLTGTTASAIDDPPRFEANVRPILKAHCWQCHGEEKELHGGMDARLVRFLLKGGESGSAIVPGDHAASLLYQRLASGEMPPGKKSSPEELERIARWIDSGATTLRAEPETLAIGDTFTDQERQHWAFLPITKPVIPDVAHSELIQTPIDAFLLARLERQGLSFSQEAGRETLLRRLYFDLVGLPPSIEAVDAFVADESPEAWSKVVDQLLNSTTYGERWARHWLDVAGYADSDGYTAHDTERKWAWKYRDYVIRSLNSDKPWNQFLVEQLAGDELLSPPYQDLKPEQADQLIATGFLRMCPDGTADGTAKNTTGAEAYYHIAKIQFQKQDYKEVEKTITKLIGYEYSNDDWNSMGMLLLGKAYLARGDEADAEVILQTLISYKPKQELQDEANKLLDEIKAKREAKQLLNEKKVPSEIKVEFNQNKNDGEIFNKLPEEQKAETSETGGTTEEKNKEQPK